MSDVTVSRIEGLGPPITGPTALGNDPRRLLRLTWALAVTDWRLQVLRLGAGLPVVLRAAADALRRPLYTVFSVC